MKNRKKKIYKTIDLFAGVGGIRLGFERAGFQTVYANDFELKCKDTYDLNFADVPLDVSDINSVEASSLPDFDFLLAGFPCQAFSVAGYREGFNDKKGRGNLFFKIAEILEKRKPLGFLLENVKNLYNHDNKKTFRVISETLESLGYDIDSAILNTMDYGNIPQNRERIYIVGFRKDSNLISKFKFPNKVNRTVSIEDIIDDPKVIDEKYYYNNKPLFERLKEHDFKKGAVYQWRRKYVRENKSGVCPTLTANMGTGGHNVPIIRDRRGIRKLTPRECARLQGFKDKYKIPKISDAHLYKQFGNSVSVPVIERIAKKIRLALD